MKAFAVANRSGSVCVEGPRAATRRQASLLAQVFLLSLFRLSLTALLRMGQTSQRVNRVRGALGDALGWSSPSLAGCGRFVRNGSGQDGFLVPVMKTVRARSHGRYFTPEASA